MARPLIESAFIAAWLLADSAGAMASPHRIECPRELPRSALDVVRPPAGWTGFVPFEFSPGLPLNEAGLMWGPPSSMTISKPDWIGKTRGRAVEKWLDLGGAESGEKWMACYYSEAGGKDVILSKRIDDNATECTVAYPEKRGGIIDIVCYW